MAVSELSARTGIGAWARSAVRSLFSHWSFVTLIAMVSLYYLLLLSNGTLQPFAPEMLDKVFDNMLIHLLHGEFTVDRDAIGFEAFTRDGRTYTYFGVFPAFLRLAGLPFFDVAQAHLARFSCWAAVVAYVALQTRMLLTVHRSLQPQEQLRGFLAIMVTATVLSGPQLYILGSAWVYHEPIVWSAAIGAGFNLVVVRAAFGGGGLRTRDLLSLAILAGLALSTRVTVGMGLYVGSILLVAWTAWERHAGSRINQLSRGDAGGGPRRIGAVAGDAGVILPIAILILFAVSLGAINFARWGNPLTFADFRYYDFSNHHRQTDFAM